MTHGSGKRPNRTFVVLSRAIRPVLLVLCALSVSAHYTRGQSSATLSGPSLGFVWNDADATMRPLQGILGNATIGNPADLGIALSGAASLNGVHFLGSAEDNPALLFINMERAPASIAAIPEVAARPTLVAGSRQGSVAALYYADQRLALIVGGFPSSARVMGRADLSLLDTAPSHMAVSDDGTVLLYVVPAPAGELDNERPDAIYSWTESSGSRFLTSAVSVGAITLAPNGDAIVADAKANEVFAIVDPQSAAARYFLADAVKGVSQPTAVAVSEDSRIYVGNAATDTVLSLDSSGVVLGVQSCNCELSGLYPLKRAVYRLSARADQTLYLLETAPSRDRVVFVPMFRASE